MKTVENNYSINALRKISHPLNMPVESQILAPSQVKAAGQMWTDLKAYKIFSTERDDRTRYLHAKLNMWLQLKMPYCRI
jgi:hypothetical protein